MKNVHGMHGSEYATMVTVYHGAYSIRLRVYERLSKFNSNNKTQKTSNFNSHVIFSRRLAQGLGVPSAELVNTQISLSLSFHSKAY